VRWVGSHAALRTSSAIAKAVERQSASADLVRFLVLESKPELEDYLPKCMEHMTGLLENLDSAYTEQQLWDVLYNECLEFGFKKEQTCKDLAGQLIEARATAVKQGSKKAYSAFCTNFYAQKSGGAAQYSAPEKPLATLPGVQPVSPDGKIVLSLMFGVKYPPYSYWDTDPGAPDQHSGIGRDVAEEVCNMCNLECIFTVDLWENCWKGNEPGQGLEGGWYHACATYTNQYQRQWSLEFSDSFLNVNKPAGILARLDDNGKPAISPSSSDLTGKKICDVAGWAPTIKTLAYSQNDCDGDKLFTGYEVVIPEEDGPDASMKLLLDGKCDGVYMYADMVDSRVPAKCNGCAWDAELYSHLGKKYAWVHTGVNDHMANGTTLTMSKKGSGVPELINPCIQKMMKTEKYYDICKKYNLTSECYANEYFPKDIHKHPYAMENDERMAKCNAEGISEVCQCSAGYCGCDAR